jgi:hypothetical protein
MFILAASAASAVCHEPGTAGDAKELLLSDSFSIAKFGVAGKRSKPPNRPTFYRALTAGQNRAHGDDQNLMEVVQRGVARTRILQLVSALDTFFQNASPEAIRSQSGRIHLQSATKISNAIPWPAGRDE